jgi:hypothetical protein
MDGAKIVLVPEKCVVPCDDQKALHLLVVCSETEGAERRVCSKWLIAGEELRDVTGARSWERFCGRYNIGEVWKPRDKTDTGVGFESKVSIVQTACGATAVDSA